MHKRASSIGIAILFISLFFIIVLLPIILILVESLFLKNAFLPALFFNARQISLLKNSLFISAGVLVFSLFVGIPYAFFVARTDIAFKKFFFITSLIPFFLPPNITVIGWLKLLRPSGLNLQFSIYGIGGVIFILGLSFFPVITLLTVSGLSSFDSRLEEAAELTCSKLKVIRCITLPLLAPYIFSGSVLVFVFALSNYGVPDLLRVNTYPMEIFVQFSAFYNTPKAVLLAFPLMCITLVLILLQRHFMGRKSYVTISSYHHDKHKLVLLKGTKYIAVIFCVLIFLCSALIPVGMLIIGAGPLDSYYFAFKTAFNQIFNSIFFSVVSATLICVLSFPLSYLIQRARKRTALFTDIISVIPFAIPASIFGVALIKFWNRPVLGFIYQTSIIIIIGYVARFSAFAVRVIESNIAQVHNNLEEYSDLVCKSWTKKIQKIIIPLSWPGIIAAWILCFSLSVGELGTTLLVSPAGEATLPIRIYTLMHYGAHELVCSLCVILILIIFLPLMLIFIANKIMNRK